VEIAKFDRYIQLESINRKTELEVRKSHKNEYTISTDKKKLGIDSIHKFFANESDWSNGIPIKTLKSSIENSLNFGLYYKTKQIGFARIISDYSTIAYLGDVYILKEYRGKGLSNWLIHEIMEHPNLQGLRRWILLTNTAEWLYKKFGFNELTSNLGQSVKELIFFHDTFSLAKSIQKSSHLKYRFCSS